MEITQDGIEEYQTRVKTSEVEVGDFLDLIEPRILTGPRGGRYRFGGVRFESSVTRIEILPNGQRAFYTKNGGGRFGLTLPGNSDQLTTALVRR